MTLLSVSIWKGPSLAARNMCVQVKATVTVICRVVLVRGQECPELIDILIKSLDGFGSRLDRKQTHWICHLVRGVSWHFMYTLRRDGTWSQ